MRNAELYLKEATVIYGVHLLSARFPELTWKLERLECAPTCSILNTWASFQLIACRVSDDTKLLRFNSLRWPEPSLLSQQHYFAACKCCSSIFTKIKLLIYIINRDSSIGNLCRYFTSVSITSASVIYSNVFHRIIR